MSVVLHQHCVGILTVSFGEKGEGEGRTLWQGDAMHQVWTVFAKDCLQSDCSVMAGWCRVLCFLSATMCDCDCVGRAFRDVSNGRGK